MKVNRQALEGLSAEERNNVERELKALAHFFEDNPLLSYYPHEKQASFHSAQQRLKAFIGGNRTGKTTSGVADCLIQAVDMEALPPHLRAYKQYTPPFHARMVVPDFKETLHGVLIPKLREWTPKSQLKKHSFDKSYRKDDQILEFENGSWFQFMTHEQDLDKFGGAALHRVMYDEEPPEDIRKECLMRLLDYNGDEIFCFTPLKGLTWAYEEIWRKRKKRGIFVVQASIDDNPHLSDEAKERILEQYTDEERAARESGVFVHFAGLVYQGWDRKKHELEIKQEHLEGKWIVCGIDPGIANTGLCWIAFDDDTETAYVFDALYLKDYNVESVAAQIRAVNAKWEIEPDVYVIDPNARVRSPTSGETLESAYIREGIYAIHGANDVEAGVNQIRTLLRERRCFVQSGLNCFEREIELYRVDDKPHKFAVVKRNDHIMDAWRYAIMSRIWEEDEEEDEPPLTYTKGTSTSDYITERTNPQFPTGPMS